MAKPAVMEGYDREFGVIVKGTLDAREALPLAVAFELEEQGLSVEDTDADTAASKAWAEEWMTTSARPCWLRVVPAPRDQIDGYTWMIHPADEGARGAFRAVEFRRDYYLTSPTPAAGTERGGSA